MVNYSSNQKKCIQESKDFLLSQKSGGIFAIEAGAGSGKTTIITEIVKQLISQHQIHPHSIKMFTFTKASAQDVLQRFNDSNVSLVPNVGTMHSTFMSLIKELIPFIRNVKLPSNEYSFINLYSKEYIAGQIFESMNIGMEMSKIFQILSILKKSPAIQHIYGDSFNNNLLEESHQILSDYNNDVKGRERDSDSNEIMIETIELLSTLLSQIDDPKIKYMVHRYLGQYLFVDECQDLDLSQICILILFAKLGLKIVVVGDSLQSLYYFRQGIGSLLFSGNDTPYKTMIELSNNLGFSYAKTDNDSSLIDNFRSADNIFKLQTHIPKNIILTTKNMFIDHNTSKYKDSYKKLFQYAENSILNHGDFINVDWACNRKKAFSTRKILNGESNFDRGHISLLSASKLLPKDFTQVNNEKSSSLLLSQEIPNQDIDDYEDNNSIPHIKQKDSYTNNLLKGKMTLNYFMNPKYKEFSDSLGDEDYMQLNPIITESIENAFLNIANGSTAALIFHKWPDAKDILNIKNIIQKDLIFKHSYTNPQLSKKIEAINIILEGDKPNYPFVDSHCFPYIKDHKVCQYLSGVPLSSICLYAIISAFLNKKIYITDGKKNYYPSPDRIMNAQIALNDNQLINNAYLRTYATDAIERFNDPKKPTISNELKEEYIQIISDYMSRVYNSYSSAMMNQGVISLPFNIIDVLFQTQKNGYDFDKVSSFFQSFIQSAMNVSLYDIYPNSFVERMNQETETTRIIFDYLSVDGIYNFNYRLKHIISALSRVKKLDATAKDIIINSAVDINKFTAHIFPNFFTLSQNVIKNNDSLIKNIINAHSSEKRIAYQKIKNGIFNLLSNKMYTHKTSSTEDELFSIFKKYKDPISHNEVVKNKKNSLVISTVHGSKGLEWDHVIYFMENEYGQSANLLYADEEETKRYPLEIIEGLNIFYVAVSRAKTNLDIVYNDNIHNKTLASIIDKKHETKLRLPSQSQIIYHALIKTLEDEDIPYSNTPAPLLNKKTASIEDKQLLLNTSSTEIEFSSCRNRLTYISKLGINGFNLNPKPSFVRAYHDCMAMINAYLSGTNIHLDERENIQVVGVINNIAEVIRKFYLRKRVKNYRDENEYRVDIEDFFNNNDEFLKNAKIWGKTISPKRNRGVMIHDDNTKTRNVTEERRAELYAKALHQNIINTIISFYHVGQYDPFQKSIDISNNKAYNNIYIEKRLQKKYNPDKEQSFLFSGSVDFGVSHDEEIVVYDYKGISVNIENDITNIDENDNIINVYKGIQQLHGYADIIRHNEEENTIKKITIILILYSAPSCSDSFLEKNDISEIPIPDIPGITDTGMTLNNHTINLMIDGFNENTLNEMIDLSCSVNKYKTTPLQDKDFKICDIYNEDDEEMQDHTCLSCDIKNICGQFGKKIEDKKTGDVL